MTDNEASAYTRTILGNMGVPGVLISPDADTYLSDEELESVKTKFEERFRGENRGRPMVMTAKTSVQMLSFSPQQLDLQMLRRVPEERITAVFGLPAIIAGLGAGLDRSTFANYAEARAAAWEDLIIPMQRDLATAFQVQLLAEYGQDTRTHRVGFDTTNVRVLQEDQNQLMTRLVAGVAGTILTPNEARKALGFDASQEDGSDSLYVATKMAPMTPTKTMLEQQAHQEELMAASEQAKLEAGAEKPADGEEEEEPDAKALVAHVARWLGDANGT
jgi:HK97 family phage portal protein